LIDELEIEFGDKLNILSGETGSGKSIIIDAVNFVLGGRVHKDFIRNGAPAAFVEALFYINNAESKAALRASGIEVDEENALLLFRSLSETGKSLCRMNGRTITLGMLKELTPYFIDLHGQHEHQSLLNQTKHIELVDKFCPETLAQLKTELVENYNLYKDVVKQLKAITGEEKDRAATLELLSFQINEIEQAKLKPNEEETLQERKTVINSAEKLITASATALEMLCGLNNPEEASAADKIAAALSAVERIAQLDPSKAPMAETLAALHSDLTDLSAELRDYYGNMEHDPQEIENIETRLDLIYGLKRKYGSTIADILSYYKTIKDRFEFMNNSEEAIAKLNQSKTSIEQAMLSICKQLSAIRKEAADSIESQMIAALRELGMKDVQFKIQFDRRDTFSLNGFDKVEFFISPNAGESLKLLAKTASGGEMSRVMLALKTVLAEVDPIETFIFDEIDTGVSGRTAQKVAEKLCALSQHHQILCITHLPQIAAMADDHYLVEKKTEDGRTTTTISRLGYDSSIGEIARLTGGAAITDVTLKAAAEMKQMAMAMKL
jgi:DNA repair protein RecN (Recombination protein N)